MIQVFEQEVLDGLQDAIANSIIKACASIKSLKHIDNPSEEVINFVNKTQAYANPNQIDLYYLEAVLVSTGWNGNDDVFLPEETWAARKTPEDKPFNFMHNDDDIIGHITGSYVEDFEGNLIPDETPDDKIPSNFNIITPAVIYAKRSNPEKQDRMEKIIAEIEEGSDIWKVSMECLFPNFDYAVIDMETGEQAIIPRSFSSASLTKHLRAYGGDGKYQNFKLGRALRGQTFSGKGLVDNPANKRSKIRNNPSDVVMAGLDWGNSDSYTLNRDSKMFNGFTLANITQEKNMTVELENQVKQLRHELAQAKEDSKKAKDELEKKKDMEAKDAKAALEATIAEKDGDIKSLTAQIDQMKQDVEAVKAELEKSKTEKTEALEKVKELETEKKVVARKAKLVSAGVAEADLEATYAKFKDSSDEVFAGIVEVIAESKRNVVADDSDDSNDAAAALDNVDDDPDSTQALNADDTVEEDESNKLQQSLASYFSVNRK